MKVNALLNTTESCYGIDTLKFKNNSSKECLFISLSSHESCHSSEGTYCTSKEEETST